MLGERAVPFTPRCYGHPHDVQTRELREVPWLELDCEGRRETQSDEPIGFERPDEERINERLRALGYASE
jgi:hypothetical protein